jgi:FtsP/CotA-like multicopper oxidase with cupredoxin domain
MHGMVDRPGDQDRPFDVPFGSVRIVRFRLGSAGTYAYWAATQAHETISNHLRWDSQLGGAIVVDPVREESRAPDDRIFVITTWLNVFDSAGRREPWYALDTINGLAWPYTERLEYSQNAIVRWRWINLGAVSHPMHLHGFYFRVDSRGDGIGDDVYRNAADRDVEVTELIRAGGTYTMTWDADRAGHWLFHCHIPAHTVAHLPTEDMISGRQVITLRQYLDEYVPRAGMGNLILGITVRGSSSYSAEARASRRLTLFVESRPESAPDAPAFRYVIEDAGQRLSEDGYVGPPLILRQGQPVDIHIVNQLTEPTSVHWHGMELGNSYYDGVSGFSGTDDRVAPPIAPGDTFDVSFTPKRAGTFAYHTHTHDQWQFRGGLAGPLIVIPSGSQFDPQTDHIIMLTSPRWGEQGLSSILLNGLSEPAPLVVHAGVPQRLRIINLTIVNQNAVVSLESGKQTVLWRPIAIDGADLPARRTQMQHALQTLTIGQTRDFEFVPTRASSVSFVVRARANGPVTGSMQIRVI